MDDFKPLSIVPQAPKEAVPSYPPEYMEALLEFHAVMVEVGAVGFSAVAVTEEGHVVSCWLGTTSSTLMTGAIATLQSDYLQESIEEYE
tara:strand:+ start:569 stop:835 length:267 start_codon:yes stop_codon:yes gene_type:complete